MLLMWHWPGALIAHMLHFHAPKEASCPLLLKQCLTSRTYLLCICSDGVGGKGACVALLMWHWQPVFSLSLATLLISLPGHALLLKQFLAAFCLSASLQSRHQSRLAQHRLPTCSCLFSSAWKAGMCDATGVTRLACAVHLPVALLLALIRGCLLEASEVVPHSMTFHSRFPWHDGDEGSACMALLMWRGQMALNSCLCFFYEATAADLSAYVELCTKLKGALAAESHCMASHCQHASTLSLAVLLTPLLDFALLLKQCLRA